MAAVLEAPAGKDLGQLANNGMQVQFLQTALSRADMNVRTIPGLILQLDEAHAWQEFVFPSRPDQVYRWSAAEFRRFIEAPRPRGCETPIYVLERVLRGTDAWLRFVDLTRGEPGGDNNPYGRLGKPEGEEEIKCDIITLDYPDTSPAPKPPTGTSVSYAVRRLKRERPDLLVRVQSGELSANAAMIAAGFRKVPTTQDLLRKVWAKAGKEEREEFLRWVCEQGV
jgi:hypothetical protein